MRLLLDADLSPSRVGEPLAALGHDVVSLAADPVSRSLIDPQVLELAAAGRRILITRNSRDFVPILRRWAEAGMHHSGCILIFSMRGHDFGRIIEGVGDLLAARPDAREWEDLALAL
jgi:hypothetical protein